MAGRDGGACATRRGGWLGTRMRAIPSVVTIVSAIGMAVLLPMWWHEGTYAALSLATGYVAAALLLATLLVTPTYSLTRRRRSPLHLPLRRSLGVHAAIIAGAHTILSFPVHLGGDVVGFFFDSNGDLLLSRFGLSNWIGLVSLGVLALLAITSTDGAIRQLGARRWKRLHRLVYAAAVLTAAHALAYQTIRNASPGLLAALILATCLLVGLRTLSRFAHKGRTGGRELR